MDFADLDDVEEQDAAEIVEKKDYFPEPEDKEDEEEIDKPVEANVEKLSKALMEERKQRRQLEKKLDLLAKQMQGLTMRVETPGTWFLSGDGDMDPMRTPSIHPSAFIAPGASIIGSVKIERDASVWFNCTVRSDNEIISIGEGSDIQDNSILHCDPGTPLTVGKNVLVGHQVCLHGCTIGDNCLIGMRTVMLDRSKVGNNCFVAAGSHIAEGREFPDNSLIGGNPAKRVMDLSEDPKMLAMAKTGALSYVQNKNRFQEQLRPF